MLPLLPIPGPLFRRGRDLRLAPVLLARQAAYAGPLDGAGDWLARWVDAGVRHLVLRVAGGDHRAQVDALAARVLPRLRGTR